MSDDPNSFDLSAAWLRKAQGDIRAFMAAFASRLEGAVPERVVVERKRDGLFSSTSHVVRVAIDLERTRYALTVDKGRLVANVAKIVHGITLKSDTVQIPEWLASLNRDLGELAARAGDSQTVLHDFLMG